MEGSWETEDTQETQGEENTHPERWKMQFLLLLPPSPPSRARTRPPDPSRRPPPRPDRALVQD